MEPFDGRPRSGHCGLLGLLGALSCSAQHKRSSRGVYKPAGRCFIESCMQSLHGSRESMIRCSACLCASSWLGHHRHRVLDGSKSSKARGLVDLEPRCKERDECPKAHQRSGASTILQGAILLLHSSHQRHERLTTKASRKRLCLLQTQHNSVCAVDARTAQGPNTTTFIFCYIMRTARWRRRRRNELRRLVQGTRAN